MLEFKTAAKKKSKNDAAVVFTIDGEEFMANPPKDSALALLVAAGASGSGAEQMYEMLQFFKVMLPEDDMTRFTAKLRDPKDAFDLVDATGVLQGLIEEFSGRPTE